MWNTTKLRFGFLAIGVLGAAIGCTEQVPSSAPSATTTVEESERTPATGTTATDTQPIDTPTLPTEGNPAAQPGVEGGVAGSAADQSDAAMIEASLASLTAADREAALKQKICPVSEAALGSMGAPIKVSVAGQEVFICCEGCEDPLKAEPSKHLAKIGLQPAEGSAVE
jgi:hypothetical protein